MILNIFKIFLYFQLKSQTTVFNLYINQFYFTLRYVLSSTLKNIYNLIYIKSKNEKNIFILS